MMRFAFLFLLLSVPCFGADPPATKPAVEKTFKAKCSWCEGKGWYEEYRLDYGETKQTDVRDCEKCDGKGWRTIRMRDLVLSLMFLTEPPEPPKTPPDQKWTIDTPTPNDILAIRARIAELAKEEAAMVASLNRALDKLGKHEPVEAIGIGRPGKNGKDGLSAYEVAKKNGFVGTEVEWLASLKGPKGDKGDTGPPGPGPIPPPDPPPIPQPTADKLWIVVLEETADRNAVVGRVLGDLGFWQGLKTLGHKYAFFDQNNPGTAAQSYVTRFGEINAVRIKAMREPLKMPVIFYVDPTKPVESNVLLCLPLPTTTAEIRASIKNLTGK